MQSCSGTCLAQKSHVLGFDEQVVLRQLQPARKRRKCLLDTRYVVASVEVADMVAFPCIGATSPELDVRAAV